MVKIHQLFYSCKWLLLLLLAAYLGDTLLEETLPQELPELLSAVDSDTAVTGVLVRVLSAQERAL